MSSRRISESGAGSADGSRCSGKAVYFASDFHLGLRGPMDAIARERRVVSWLHRIAPSASSVQLLGDIFDFWFEYSRVVPRGFTRFLGALSALCDAGIPVHIHTGNHDVWMFDYLSSEVGVRVHRGPREEVLLGVPFYLSHGDELGATRGYRLMRWAFSNYALQRLFAMVHPSLSFCVAHSWSYRNRYSKELSHCFRGDEEPAVRHILGMSDGRGVRCYVIGHLHTPCVHALRNGAYVVVLGDWIRNFTYAKWDGRALSLFRDDPTGPPLLLSEAALLADGASGFPPR